ncbi:hypothetical protein HBDW_40820 [Herbaspirillum sp. DW155]|uniref:hypothetical protein n=1 Tax=Herbaspirillum sp. DW155 TaxID=3095609 RepID=UPI0030901D5D|nr:hypothetical protein HBDW_40820 [Herbaspirillum sp. DW155]
MKKLRQRVYLRSGLADTFLTFSVLNIKTEKCETRQDLDQQNCGKTQAGAVPSLVRWPQEAGAD